MRNVILDRFPIEGINEFSLQLEKKIDIKLIITKGEKIDFGRGIENYDSLSLSKGIGVESRSWVLNRGHLEYFSKYEGVFLSMLSRNDVYKNSFTTEEMSIHYYSLLNFWMRKLESKKIDLIYCMDVPHVPSSFSLYLASKFLRIAHVYVDCPLVYNRFHFLGCSFKNRMLLVEGNGVTSDEFIDAHNKFFLDYKTNSTESISKYYSYLYSRKSKYFRRALLIDLAGVMPFSIKSLLKGTIKYRGFRVTEAQWKISRRLWSDEKSAFNRISFFFAKYLNRLKIHNLKKSYRKICNDHAGLSDYILFAPPSEPEASTLPISLEMRRSYIALKMLIDSLPEGVKVVYKEHPISFDQLLLFVSEWKSRFYYENLAKLDRVEFVRDDAPTRELIKNSIGVATINGTIALEALSAGRHCITFSPQWYDDLNGIHLVQTSSDIKSAISLMVSQSPPSPHPEQVKFSENFLALDGLSNNNFSSNDYKIICASMWKASNDFLNLDDRKWEV
jgi:hypothetical protein